MTKELLFIPVTVSNEIVFAFIKKRQVATSKTYFSYYHFLKDFLLMEMVPYTLV